MVYIHFAKYILHWGFSVRTPFMSGAQLSYRVPPPTTIVGALAHAYFAKQGNRREVSLHNGKLVSRVVEFVKKFGIKYATCTCFRTVQFQSVVRYFIGFYLAREMYDDFRKNRIRVPEDLFGPVSFGYVAAPTATFMVVLIARERIDNDVFYSVTRIGSRESIVCPNPELKVEVFSRSDLTECKPGDFVDDVRFPFPQEAAHKIKGVYVTEQCFIPYAERDFIIYYTQGPKLEYVKDIVVPILMSSEDPGLEVDLRKESYVLDLKEGKLLIPKEVLQN